jgi:hypothetical protein
LGVPAESVSRIARDIVYEEKQSLSETREDAEEESAQKIVKKIDLPEPKWSLILRYSKK